MNAHNVLHQMLQAPHAMVDPGAGGTITVDRQLASVPVVTATAEARTLAQPTKPGLLCTVELKTDGGDCTLTVTGAADGNATFTLNDAGDYVTFLSIDIGGSYYWSVIASRGCVKNSAVADTKQIDIRGKTTATSGDNRSIYNRYEFAGAGGGGESFRSFSTLSAACGTVHGAHISLNVSTTGYVTGLGVGVRGQLYVTSSPPAGGTYYGMQAEMYFDASASVASVTEHAILAVHATGDATAAATCKNALSIKGGAASGGGDMISPGTSMGTVTGTIRVLINGVVAYIPYYSHEGHA